MTHRWTLGILLLSLLQLLFIPAARGESVAVNRGEGQGYVVSHRNNCYLILPDHVIGRNTTLSLSAGAPPVAGEAQVFQRFPESDLSVAFVRGSLQSRCSMPFRSLPASVDSLLSRNHALTLVRVEASGIVMRSPVVIDEILYEKLEVRSSTTDGDLSRGTSGAFLFAGDIPVAMMLEARSAESGTALRIDTIVNRIGRLLEGGPSIGDHSGGVREQQISSQGDKIPFRIVSCAPEVMAPEFVCSNLQAGVSPVVMPAGSHIVIEVEFQRTDNASSSIRTVSLISNPSEAGELAVPRGIAVELDSSSGVQRRWRHLASGDMSPLGEFTAHFGAGQHARRARIHITSSWNPDRPVRIDRIEIK